MELKEAILGRRSIRQFLAKQVPEKTIKEILKEAVWCPSWGNTQPWEVKIVTGPVLEQLKKENKEAIVSGKDPAPDIPMPENWPVPMKKRYANVGKRVFDSLSIARNDKKGRREHYADMFAFFDAPALLLFTTDKRLAVEYSLLDIGIFIQNFCLLAYERQLGTCVMAAAIHFPEILRRLCSIPDDQRIVIGIALGYPDKKHPVNQFERERIPLEDFVRE
ncbi:MAG: nitroreductase [Deltaproteobacteria bacterium]|nr:nitroreductase [Deltaproteobacteria bacterium]